ncbi:histone deacetylase [Halobacteria archaeon AArc-dxtr1]|nr:histone deacetylase [Halobacteria archaeon AArc-dxtr1]
MQFGYNEACLAHDPGQRHPESPDRLRAIRQRLSRLHGVTYVDGTPASMETMALAHDREHVDAVAEFCADGGGEWDPDTTASDGSWDAIRHSAGLACWAVEAALGGADGRQTPFSLGRPPGHHAVEDDAMGFCFINNAAVAARHAQESLGAERVVILDWDVHHGNGTQDIFYDDESVFVFSLHEEGLYPGTGELEETGAGTGDGTTMNVPLPAGTDDDDYVAIVDGPVATAIESYDPDLILVSAGFDAHRHDPISRIRLTTEAYALLADRMRSLAETTGADLAFLLEGGYGLEVLADSVATIHETFDGREPVEPANEVSDGTLELIEAVQDVHDRSS